MKEYKVTFSVHEIINYSCPVEANNKKEAIEKFKKHYRDYEWIEEDWGGMVKRPYDVSVEGYWVDDGDGSSHLKRFKSK